MGVSTLSTSHLAKLCETGEQATPDQIAALLEWIDGTPLSDISGYLSVYSEENSATDPDELALRWIEQICRALGVLHHGRLAHGDVSPRNIIIRGTDAVLTDYDTVTPFGRVGCSAGTPDYASPGASSYQSLSAADDFFALCASFFYALFECNPFRYGDALLKDRGANWSKVDRTMFPLASQFVERGLSNDPFISEREALSFMADLRGETTSAPNSKSLVTEIWQDNHEPWLGELLRSYPGGKHGNRETRGLDSDYALQTYVPTMLDESLFRRIGERTVSLVVLCGNAGDGKTAFLQHLARRLGMEPHKSEQRIWDEQLPDGLHVYANLDGSAAYNDRSASELLDELFQPFLECQPPADRVHLLAVNSGPLLAWIEETESLLGDHLESALEGELVSVPEWLCFVDLNARSLVGGRDEHQKLSTVFLDELVTKMLGPAYAWQQCGTCTAQSRCSAWASIQALRDPVRGDLLKKRIFRALQAVHVRGEVHPTARELRAALTYILFDIHECADLHANPNQDLVQLADRAFDSLSPLRQGEILRELAMLDPALEAHPMIDRVLRREYYGLSLRTARRTAYFNWSDEEIERVGGTRGALGLARGKHLKTFLDVAMMGVEQRDALCRELCLGIARLEELPAVAFQWNADTVPLRITPRTPTESSFWVTKPLARFSLHPDLPRVREPVERLHNALLLTYRYQDGRRAETLRLSSELFHLLLELRDGYQLSDTLSDDTFAHLSIFTQRLVQEDERLMHCWNPMDENTVFEFAIQPDGGVQKMVLTALGGAKNG